MSQRKPTVSNRRQRAPPCNMLKPLKIKNKTYRKSKEYEIEYVDKFVEIEGKPYFKVKWVGFREHTFQEYNELFNQLYENRINEMSDVEIVQLQSNSPKSKKKKIKKREECNNTPKRNSIKQPSKSQPKTYDMGLSNSCSEKQISVMNAQNSQAEASNSLGDAFSPLASRPLVKFQMNDSQPQFPALKSKHVEDAIWSVRTTGLNKSDIWTQTKSYGNVFVQTQLNLEVAPKVEQISDPSAICSAWDPVDPLYLMEEDSD